MDEVSRYKKMKRLGLSPLACRLFSKRFGPEVFDRIEELNRRDARKAQKAQSRRRSLGQKRRRRPKIVDITVGDSENDDEDDENEDEANLEAEIALYSQVLAHNEADKASRQERKQYNLLPVLTEEEMMIEMD